MTDLRSLKLIVALSGLLLLSLLQPETNSRNAEKIRTIFSEYIDSLHPQKVYLHTDKYRYFSGEYLRFRVYLLDGITHVPATKSQHVYVELIDPYNRIVQVIRVRTSSGTKSGEFPLADTIPEGIYQIRAYTNWLKNMGPEYYFVRNLEIRNVYKKLLITPKQAKRNKKVLKGLDKQKTRYSIGFFPEGGNILAGRTNRIAFKAENEFGEGINVKGKIIDSKKSVIAEFSSEFRGMGSFYLNALRNEKYTAHVQFEGGRKTKMVLQEAVDNAVGIQLIDESDVIFISIKSNKLLSQDRSANEFVLIGHVRGEIYHSSASNLIDNDTIVRIAKNSLPSGIVHFTLFNNRLNPVSERLFFINHNDFYNFNVNAEASSDTLFLGIRADYPPRELHFSGSVSVLVSDSNTSNLPSDNIISDLLLTSDLPGYIPDPAYYLSSNDQLVKHHVDLLMLTHGWQRYLWPDIINEKYPEIRYNIENGITVQGKITRDVLEFPLRDASVRMIILSEYNDEFLTYSGHNGNFKFDRLYYSDTIDVKIIARKKGGGKNLVIDLGEPEFDDIVKYSGDFFLTTSSEINMKAYRKYQGELAREQIRQREKELDSIHSQTIHGKPDYVLWADDLPSGYSNLLEAMHGRIPGVYINGNQVIIRGVGTIYGNTDPLVLVDGTYTSVDILRNIPVEDVDRVEILKGPSASMYGSRGGNGVIAVYTKRGYFMKRGEISFSMLGYHVAEKFYSPSAELLQQRINHKQLPVTLYWNPNLELSGDELNISIPLHIVSDEIEIILEGTDEKGKLGFAYARIH